MFLPSTRLGAIEDLEFDLRWNSATLAHEIKLRVDALHDLGVGRRSLVAIARSASAHFFADLLATWQLGATVVCLDHSLTSDELQTLIDYSKPDILLAPRDTDAGGASIRVVDLEGVSPSRRPAPSVEVDLDDPALVLFTSGTTGAPKGVVLSHRAISARILGNVDAIGITPLARTLVTLPTHFGHGLIGNSLTPLFSGGQIVLHPPGVLLTRNLGHIIDEYRISFISSVPTFWRMATRYNPPSGNSLVRIHIASAPLSADLWTQVAAWSRAEVVNCYGMTETATWVAGASSRKEGIADGLVGKPWGTSVAVIDDDGIIQTSGDGEIVVRSPAMMSGYLDRPDLTAQVLRDGWFHTGDRGSVDRQGRICLTGRIKDEINRAGFKVQPAEIDMLLERNPAVSEACVFSIPDSASGESVAAAIRPANGAEINLKDLETWCLERLRREAVPEHWFIVDDLPRNARGKISRDVVRQTLAPVNDARTRGRKATVRDTEADHSTAREALLGRDIAVRVRNAVARAWTESFGRQSLAMNWPWDESAGDSIDALRFLFSIEEQLGVQLDFDVLQPGATPEIVTAAVRKALDSFPAQTDAPLVPSLEQQPLVFFVPPMEGDMVHLVRFRSAFSDRLRFEVIRYPSARELLRSGERAFDEMVKAAVTQVRARRNGAPYVFIGVSSGGFVAWEMARCLLASGERVNLVGLIDTRRPITRLTPRLNIHPLHSIIAELSGRLAFLLSRTARVLVDKSAFTRLRMILSMAALLQSKDAVDFRFWLTALVRRKAIETVANAPLELPTTLFRSGDEWPGPYDYGWGALCKQLIITNVGGAHDTIFQPEGLDVLRERTVEAVETAMRRGRLAG